MILQELVRYYDRQRALPDGDIAAPGWVRRPIDYLIELKPDGQCINFQTKFTFEKGKRVSWPALLPAIGKQSLKHTNSGKDANLLWDNASFVLGWQDHRGTKLDSFIETMNIWFPECQDVGICAIRYFLKSIKESPLSVTSLLNRFDVLEDFELRDPLLAFQLAGDICGPIHFRPEIINLYTDRLNTDTPTRTIGNCLISGRQQVALVNNETVLKGVWGAQPAGANLVSFNKPSFISYGKQDRNGENAPVSLDASFAYSTALNHLLESKRCRLLIGDFTLVFWSEQSTPFESLLSDLFSDDRDDPARGVRAVKALYESVQSSKLPADYADVRFFVLGLAAPSGGRLTVRSWNTLRFSELAPRFLQWFQDLSIVHAPHEPAQLSLVRLLAPACAPSKERPSGDLQKRPALAAEVLRNVLSGLPLPASWLLGLIGRIRAEQADKGKDGKAVPNVSYPRAASIKAILNRAIRLENSGEMEFKMALDLENPNPAYRLGRLFATYERIQSDAATREINRTIRDAYFGAAMATPASVFSRLENLNGHHMRTLRRDKPGLYINRDRLVGEILNGVSADSAFPKTLTLSDQGRFALGYYHQRQDFFTRKDTETATPNSQSPGGMT